MKKIPITLYGEQSTLLKDWLTTNKHCIDIVHAGAGKTFLASIALPIFASDEKYHHGRDIIYSAPTMNMISSLIWEPLKKTCREHFNISDQHINNSAMTIRFPNGVFIRCKSAEQRENLRGLNAAVWLADEAALYHEESLFEIGNRLRPVPGKPETEGRLIVISTPHGTGPLYDLYQTALSMPDKFIVRHFNHEQMRSGNKQFIERQKQILSPMKFASDYLCSFESVEDQFFYAFDKHKHCAPVVDKGGDLYHFADFNKKRMCAIIAQVENPGELHGKIEIIKSYAIPDCSTEGIAQAIRQDFKKRHIYSIIDMSGTQVNRDTTSPFGLTDKIILEKYGFTIINSRKSNPLISDTDNTSNAFISRNQLIVPPTEHLLIEALQNYHFENGTRKKLVKYNEQKFAHIDGLGDALRYGIHHLFPITHTQEFPEYVGMDPKLAKQFAPGREYLPDQPVLPGVLGAPTFQELFEEATEDYQIWS